MFHVLWGKVEFRDGVRVCHVDPEGGNAFIHLYSFIQRLTVLLILLLLYYYYIIVKHSFGQVNFPS